ncbi:MAG: GNAT family N-acetyltransferase [Clostridiales bacterium]|nr:GNAT family N-acetyltransferase [Clostridiales bacterium]
MCNLQDITFQYAKQTNDYIAISKLATIIWEEHYTSIIGKAQVAYMVEKFQSAKAIKKSIDLEQYSYLMVYYQRQLAGYCAYCIKENSLFLSKFYVHKNFRGLKIASSMMKQVFLFSKKHELTSVFLTVNKHNTHSISIYKHFGFSITNKLVTDIGQGFIMDDYLLTLMI